MSLYTLKDDLPAPNACGYLTQEMNIETLSVLGSWGLEMQKRYPCSLGGSMTAIMAETCAAIWNAGRMQGIKEERSRQKKTPADLIHQQASQ